MLSIQNNVDQCPDGLPLVLQGVLGELSYESDAAERLRSELRGGRRRGGAAASPSWTQTPPRLAAAEQVPLWLCQTPHSRLGHRHSIHLTAIDCFNHMPALNCSRCDMRAGCCGAQLEDIALTGMRPAGGGRRRRAVQREAERRDAEGRLQEEATMLRRTLGAAVAPFLLTVVPALRAPPDGLLACGHSWHDSPGTTGRIGVGMDACSDQHPQTGTASSPAAETMKRMRLLNSDEDTSVDRRIVVKLLTTYFERGQPPDVLQLMARMLGFSGANPPSDCQQFAPVSCCWQCTDFKSDLDSGAARLAA